MNNKKSKTIVILNTHNLFIINDIQLKLTLPMTEIAIIIKSRIVNKVLFKTKNGDLISLRFEETTKVDI